MATTAGMEFILIKDILLCKADGSYTSFTMKDGNTLLVSKHLKEYENLLSEHQFMRVHNKFLINMMEVQRFVKADGGYILMKNDARVSISPKKRDLFIDKMINLNHSN